MGSIKIFKSTEISDDIWQKISFGYEQCFNINYTINQLKDLFKASITGFTLHAIMFSDEGEIMGHNYLQPYPYLFKNEEIIFGLSGGTFVIPKFRKDIFIYHDLVKALYKSANALGWKAQGGVPNENSYQYAIRINKSKYIGDLRYYILPLSPSKILKKYSLSFLDKVCNSLAISYAKVYSLTSLVCNTKEKLKPLRINRSDKFINSRFNNKGYKEYNHNNIRGFYKVYNEDGIITAYLMDFTENNIKTNKALSKTVNFILKHEKIDAILYIGTMNLKQNLLFKTPKRFEPQRMGVVLDIIDKDNLDIKEAFSNIDNLDFSLMNFDVR